MTDAQRQVLDEVRQKLDEHFEAWVLSFQTENDDDKTDTLDVLWHGSYATTLGLLEFSSDEAKYQQRKAHEKRDAGED